MITELKVDNDKSLPIKSVLMYRWSNIFVKLVFCLQVFIYFRKQLYLYIHMYRNYYVQEIFSPIFRYTFSFLVS